jgi:triosephosphate isomerase
MTSRRRRALVLGNWKMHMTATAAGAAARAIAQQLTAARDREVAVAPPFTALLTVAEALRDSPLLLAAQNLFWEDEGPYTGEISGPMLADIGVTYVLVGHSERRIWLGETDRVVNRKVVAALRCGLHPVICVGEDQEARAAGRAGQVVRDQLLLALAGVGRGEAARLAVAYEPVWAIGTGRAATPDDAAEMHALIRVELEALFAEDAGAIRILYGGSVSGKNIDPLMARAEVDGVLVGGASLRPAEFVRIAAFAPAA